MMASIKTAKMNSLRELMPYNFMEEQKIKKNI